MRRAALLLVLLGALAGAGCSRAAAAPPPPVRHVFVIVLENRDAGVTFGRSSPAPYLARTLRAAGAFVPRYYGIAHASLPNYLAMVSGQAPNPQTRADCQRFTALRPGTRGAGGQAVGSGCAYPAWVPTLAGQLEARGLRWKGYMEDMGADRSREARACAHPAIGARDPTQAATARDQYATRHNPFVYFRSITRDAAGCRARDVNLDRLPADLADPVRTPNYAFITPDLCHDAHDAVCADGGPGGLRAADGFLRRWVPRITSSPAFRRDGLLVVTFDEAENDSSACCATPTGGGRVGAVLLSRYIRPRTVSRRAYNHYALLRGVEDLFGLRHLGLAGRRGLRAFGDDIYTDRSGTTDVAGRLARLR